MSMSVSEFLASLPAPLSRRGADYANDVVLAKRIRAELAQAVKVGAIQAGTEFSVRINHHASLTVEIVRWQGAVFHPTFEGLLMSEMAGTGSTASFDPPRCERPVGRGTWHAELSDALNDALHAADVIANRHNYDNSDLQTDHFDVGYYLTVNASHVRRVAQHGIALDFDPAFKALYYKAADAARTLPKNVIKAECGKAGIEFMSKWVCERIIKLAERANGRPLVYDKSRRRWVAAQEAA